MREVALLFGLCLASSVVFTIIGGVDGERPEHDVAAGVVQYFLALIFAIRNWKIVQPTLRFPSAMAWVHALAVAGFGLPALGACFWLLGQLGFAFHEYLPPYLRSGWPVWPAFVVMAGLTPFAEELMFRGVIQQKLEALLRPGEALIVQAALFSALHLSPVILVTHFAMGVGLGWLLRRSGSLYPGMALHALWNAAALWTELPS